MPLQPLETRRSCLLKLGSLAAAGWVWNQTSPAWSDEKTAGKLIIGICNGLQILVKSGVLLPDRADEPIATLTLNRPDARNALSAELLTTLAELIEAWDADPDVRCFVIAGSDEYFAAGADVKAMLERSAQDAMVTGVTAMSARRARAGMLTWG